VYGGEEETPKEKFLMEVVEKYNKVCSFLRGYDQATRDYLSFILVNMLSLTDLDSLDSLLTYLESHE